MLARPYNFRDAKGCDHILRLAHAGHGITDPTTDEIFVVGDVGKPSGMLVYREAAYIHELECGDGVQARLRADALANYAVAAARTKGLKSAVFLIKRDNERMKRWAESIGAIDQTLAGDSLYLLTPP